MVGGGGGYRYSTTPDDWAATERGAEAGPVAMAALALDGTVLLRVDPARNPLPRAQGPTATSAAGRAGRRVDVADNLKVLGDVTPNTHGESVPLVRLRPGPGVENPPAAPGHRLSIDWQATVDEGFEPEGVVGYVQLARHRMGPPTALAGRQGLRLAADPGRPTTDPAGGWVFDGTLGTAWQPGIRRMASWTSTRWPWAPW